MIVAAPRRSQQLLDLVQPLLGDLQPLAVREQPLAALAPAELVGREVAGDAADPDDRDQRQQRDLALAGDEAADDHRGLAGRDEAEERAGLEEREQPDGEVGPLAERLARRPRAPARSSAAGSRRRRSAPRPRSRPARRSGTSASACGGGRSASPRAPTAAASQVNFTPRRRAWYRRRAGARALGVVADAEDGRAGAGDHRVRGARLRAAPPARARSAGTARARRARGR